MSFTVEVPVDPDFVSPIADWPQSWKDKFLEVLTVRLQEAVDQGWNITLVGNNFNVDKGDEATSAHVIEILQRTQSEVEWLMSREN
jgi:hypothetical protein